MTDKRVLVIGGGFAGLAAALSLAELGIRVDLLEKTDFLGGHAIQYTCKATDKCVKCGACMVEEKLDQVVHHPGIRLLTGSRLEQITSSEGFHGTVQAGPVFIAPGKCTGCGLCFEQCPSSGAVAGGYSKNHIPFYAISAKQCLYLKNKSCTICQDACPEKAIDLERKGSTSTLEADAIIIATGFKPFSPEIKPYGYGVFKNVVTNLDMERMLRQNGWVRKPSDHTEPGRIAFVQCVGSRDARLGHLWCSKVCCGSALRMARLIKTRQPETDITVFYMDIQTFGKDFEQFYANIKEEVRMVRAIPGDIDQRDGDRLAVTFWDNHACETIQENFDIVVLSVGIEPCKGTQDTADLLNLQLSDSGFLDTSEKDGATSVSGVFAAGTAIGPMSIPETIASAGQAVWEVVKYLDMKRR